MQAARLRTAPDDPASAGRSWWVEAGGRVYGPYSESRVALFVQEGRVTGETRVSGGEQGPFASAARQPALAALFGPARSLASGPAVTASHAASAVLDALAERPRAAPAAARPLLVFAALQTLPAPRFEEALAAHGPFQPIAHGLWLVRARLGPAALRNALSRRLRGPDLLIVVEADPDAAAWFNLDPEAERALRRLWIG